jgi:hypothetical protein
VIPFQIQVCKAVISAAEHKCRILLFKLLQESNVAILSGPLFPESCVALVAVSVILIISEAALYLWNKDAGLRTEFKRKR